MHLMAYLFINGTFCSFISDFAHNKPPYKLWLWFTMSNIYSFMNDGSINQKNILFATSASCDFGQRQVPQMYI